MIKYFFKSGLLLFLLLVLAGFNTLSAQIRGNKLWNELRIAHDFSKKISGSFSMQQRFIDPGLKPERLIVEPGIAFSPVKKLSIELVYRSWAGQKPDEDQLVHHRFNINLSKTINYHDFSLTLKSGFQYRFPERQETVGEAEKTWRNSINFRYAVFGTRHKPGLKYELFTLGTQKGLLNTQWRTTLSDRIFINENQSIKVFFSLEKEFNNTQLPGFYTITGWSWRINL